MEDLINVEFPSLTNWSYCNPSEGMPELGHSLLYTSLELEATVLSAKEEITKREVELFHFKELLAKAIKERDEAKSECQILMVDKLILQQQLQAGSPTSSTENESKFTKNFTNPCSDSAHKTGIISSPPQDQLLLAGKLAAARHLPEKGKLLQAVKEAGPLLQTLLMGGGPLPQWQRPPPQLESIEIPPVNIMPSLTPQNSLSSGSSTSLLSVKKRVACEVSDSVSPKNRKLVHHHH